jgi:PKD repeat protein
MVNMNPIHASLSAAVLLASIWPIHAGELNPQGARLPDLRLSRRARAAHLVGELGDRLPDVAQWYGLSPQGLRELCDREPRLLMDEAAQLLYSCEAPAASTAGRLRRVTPLQTGAATGSGAVALGPFPDSQTFLLHSRAGSTRKIYLDFNGHTTSGTSWNSGATFTTPPYDSDGAVNTSFSTAELANIQTIYQRVAEDFAPLDVDVTTEDPGVEALRRTSSTDGAYGVRVCIGGASADWLGSSAGGVAYVGSFNWSSDTPCYAFTSDLGNGYEKYVAEAVSHEVGHTLGLNHDGQNATSTTAAVGYYTGHADWAPIMGVGYYKNITQWSKGDYSLANNLQDDLAVMPTYGAPLRVDDHGDTTSVATVLSGTSANVAGVIHTRADRDVFRFNAGAGALNLTATVASPSANLDVVLALYDGLGNLVTSVSPASTLGASLTATLTSGTYYVMVDGGGNGTPSNGYDDYGSLGAYALSGSWPASMNQPPSAAASGSPASGVAPLTTVLSSAGSTDTDGSIASYFWDFGDGTQTSSAANPSHVYQNAGTYTASLTVTDNGGLTASRSTVITVTSPTVVMSIGSITMSLATSNRGAQGRANVLVRTASGAPVASALVTGSWSGATNGGNTLQTNSQGIASFSSSRVRVGSGATFTFTVTGVSKSGATYNPAGNGVTTSSITVP